MKKLITILGLLGCIIIIPIIGVAFNREGKLVEVESLSSRVIRSSILASGKLIYQYEADLSPEIIGRIEAVTVKEGAKVSKGQLIIQIDDKQMVAQVDADTALAQVRRTEVSRHELAVSHAASQFIRMKTLYDRGQINLDSFETSEFELNLAKLDLQRAHSSLLEAEARLARSKDHLKNTRIYSPIDGVVTSIDIKVGETAIPSAMNIPGSTLAKVADTNSVYSEVHVDEADIANVEVGNEAEIIVIAYPERPIAGVVESISSTADIIDGRQGRGFTVKIRLPEDLSMKVSSGMTCRVEIFSKSKEDVIAVPIRSVVVEESVTGEELNRFVFVKKDGRAEKVAIETGIADDKYLEVTGDTLQQGDKVISGPDIVLQHLKQGDLISTDSKM